MFLDSCTYKKNGKTYTRHLLRECYRDGSKIKHRTIANLAGCSPQEISAIRLALKHKDSLEDLAPLKESLKIEQGKSVGAVMALYSLCKELKISESLGLRREGKLALWQVIARVISQGSRLKAVRLARNHCAIELLGLDRFNEDDLYKNLEWLCDNQAKIEKNLFKKQGKSLTNLYLYDVTSSYLEGKYNELAQYGYNRDKKKGKKQIVIGLLCDEEGDPVSIEGYEGNTKDNETFIEQVRKVAEQFGGLNITFVGDRGMIKSPQIDNLPKDFYYITAITKPEIEKLLKDGLFQMSLFDEKLNEVESENGIRYILKRNPVRAEEIAKCRQEKLQRIIGLVGQSNRYLIEHKRALPQNQLKYLEKEAEKLKIEKWVKISESGREIKLEIDVKALYSESRFDGCYVLKTNVSKSVADKEKIHSRYKELSLVEKAFRTMKTTELEVRPLYLRLEKRTRGHLLVVMLAYKLIKELRKRWKSLDLTVEEGIKELETLTTLKITIKEGFSYRKIPEPNPQAKRLLDLAKVHLPNVLPSRENNVATKKKLLRKP